LNEKGGIKETKGRLKAFKKPRIGSFVSFIVPFVFLFNSYFFFLLNEGSFIYYPL
jgi:hypothetical protein